MLLIRIIINRLRFMSEFFSFPDPVNETSARIVAAGVVLQGLLFLVVGSGWLLVALAYGFLARVLTGPTASPLGQLATRVLTPRLGDGHRFVPGPPKRFAQGIGVAFSVSAAVAWSLGALGLAQILILGLVFAATLEAGFAVCLGCIVFNQFWECQDCADITNRVPAAAGN